MPNPFSYYNIGQNYPYINNKGSKCLLMKIRTIRPFHTGYCSDCEWEEEIDVDEVFLPLPESMMNDNEVKDEFKFIIDKISEDNLPDWFEEWYTHIQECGGSGYCGSSHKKIVYQPLCFTYIPSFK